MAKIIIAKMKLKTGPAAVVATFCHTDFEWKLSLCFIDILLSLFPDKSSSPLNFTYPPTGNNATRHSVPDLSYLPQICLPIPIEKVSTPIPHHFPTK